MKTKIYKTLSEFLERNQQLENGVSEQFATDNPEFEKQNGTNKACWNCSDCSDCSDCFRCSGCSRCSGLEENKGQKINKSSKSWFNIPIIPNLHQTVLAAVSLPRWMGGNTGGRERQEVGVSQLNPVRRHANLQGEQSDSCIAGSVL